MPKLKLLLAFFAAALSLHAQGPSWQPAPGHTQIPLWPHTPPDAHPATEPEWAKTSGPTELVGGRPYVYVNAVSVPTYTVYAPQGHNTGAAVIVYPGGGYQILAIDLEGTEVCDWLITRGITCVVVKYRVPGVGKLPKSGGYPAAPQALEDAQRAISVVRSRAAELHIDPHKIGVLGFSAGGHLVAATSVHFAQRVYAPIDAIDKVSCRPDFAVALYPGHLSVHDNSIELNPDIRDHITRDTPTTFLLQNENDQVDRIEDAVSYFMALKKAGVPAEMHIYAEGGHAFGLRRTSLPATNWPALVETWLHTTGVLAP